jgi:hypothetical protein
MIQIELCEAQRNILAQGGLQPAAQFTAAAQQADGDAHIKQLGHGLRSDLNVAEEKNDLQLVIGNIEQDGFILLDDEPITDFAQHRALLDEI